MLGDHVCHKHLVPFSLQLAEGSWAVPTPFLKHPSSLPSLKPQFFHGTELLMAAAQCQEWLPLAVVHPL